jgi:tetratricopeptide (TPR) repeat protein
MFTAKKAGAWLLCLAVSIAIAAVCHSQAFARIAAKVVDHNGEPVQGALVTVTSAEVPSFKHSKKTNKRGQTIVTFTVGTAIYDFTIEMEGYQTLKVEVQPRVGTIEERVFTLSPVGAAVAGDMQAASETPAAPTLASRKVRRYNEGVEAQQEGDLEGAMAMFREAAEIDPEFAPAFTGIATVAMEQGNYREAAEAAERAVTLDPESYRALQLRYDAYRNLGDEAKAAAAAEALRQAGDVTEATARTFREAVEAYQAGDSETAQARFSQALDLDPDLVAAYSNLAQIYMREGEATRAAAMADEVLRRRPGDVSALKVQYEALHQLGDDEGAERALEAVVAADPEWAATALFDHAQELFNANRVEEAGTIAEEILTVRPDHPGSLYLAGLCANSAGDVAAAKAHLEHFLEVAPDHQMAPVARDILKYLQ